MKAVKIKMTDSTGNVFFWTVRYVARAFNCGGKLKKARHISGWSYTDHEGYERFSEGNWIELVANFKLTAENYGFTTNIS